MKRGLYFSLWAIVACSPREGSEQLPIVGPRPEYPGVILIVNDTLRSDRALDPRLAPRIAAFARTAVDFRSAWSQAPWTKPSMATLFTSLYPSIHGIDAAHAADQSQMPVDLALCDAHPTLAETLTAAGYRTAAFVGNPWLDRGMGFERGFQLYDDSHADWETAGPAIYAAALGWLAALPDDQPFLAVVHVMEGHRPYTGLPTAIAAQCPPPSTPLPKAIEDEIASVVQLLPDGNRRAGGIPPSIELLVAAYEEEVRRADLALGYFLKAVEGLDLASRTAIVFTADHGEALFDRGYGNHGNGFHEDEISIPLLCRFPGVGPATVESPVGLIDVFPTLCDWLGVAPPPNLQGVSWLRWLEPDRLLMAEAAWIDPRNFCVRRGDWKAIHQPYRSPDSRGHGLFDLATDPGESTNLLDDGGDSASARFDELISSARRLLEDAESPVLEPASSPLGRRQRHRLEELGYLQGGR